MCECVSVCVCSSHRFSFRFFPFLSYYFVYTTEHEWQIGKCEGKKRVEIMLFWLDNTDFHFHEHDFLLRRFNKPTIFLCMFAICRFFPLAETHSKIFCLILFSVSIAISSSMDSFIENKRNKSDVVLFCNKLCKKQTGL